MRAFPDQLYRQLVPPGEMGQAVYSGARSWEAPYKRNEMIYQIKFFLVYQQVIYKESPI